MTEVPEHMESDMVINENFRLRQRIDKIWELAWTDPTTGKPKRKSTGTRNKDDAAKMILQFKADALKKKMPTVPTIGELTAKFLENMKVRGKPEKSILTAKISLRPIDAKLGGLRWNQLTQDNIDWYAQERLKDERQGPSAKYVRHHII